MSTPSLVLAPHTFCFRRLSSGAADRGCWGPGMELKLASAVEEKLRPVPCLNATRGERGWGWNGLVAKRGVWDDESKLGRPEPSDVDVGCCSRTVLDVSKARLCFPPHSLRSKEEP